MGNEPTKNWSFAELENDETVSAEDLTQALEQYAFGGWAVSPRCVIKVYVRVRSSVSEEQLSRMIKACEYGAANNRREVSRNEYREVLNILQA